ncbi:hypothetical protein [Rothia sp. ZJ1223]|uniref:hypothetical protein n=1 Tax=Rothia sp. ZJ1223 TaxID=2811098 RepID=UPI0019587AA9|nr:hypothetical protein [Rothia sp. ZJ1223]MBM7052220.1 hypothetical protein [Rothia sp. ZJ1223]
MPFDEVIKYLIERLEGDGIRALSRAEAAHTLPAVIVSPADFTYDRLSIEAYTAEIEIYIIAADSGTEYQPLQDLYPIAKKLAEEYGARGFEALTVTLKNMGNADGLPGLKTTIKLDVKETTANE